MLATASALRLRLRALQAALWEMVSAVEDGSSDIPQFTGRGAALHLATFASLRRHEAFGGDVKSKVEKFLAGSIDENEKAAASATASAWRSYRRTLRTNPDAPAPDLG